MQVRLRVDLDAVLTALCTALEVLQTEGIDTAEKASAGSWLVINLQSTLVGRNLSVFHNFLNISYSFCKFFYRDKILIFRRGQIIFFWIST